MGIGKWVGKATGETIQGALKGAGGFLRDVRAAITGEEAIPPDVKVRLTELLDRVDERTHEALMGQIELNKIEAASTNWFVAGWRPFIGWVCGVSLAAYYLPQFVLGAILWLKLSWAAEELVAYPIGTAGLMELVLALLGMGTIRTAERLAGKARN